MACCMSLHKQRGSGVAAMQHSPDCCLEQVCVLVLLPVQQCEPVGPARQPLLAPLLLPWPAALPWPRPLLWRLQLPSARPESASDGPAAAAQLCAGWGGVVRSGSSPKGVMQFRSPASDAGFFGSPWIFPGIATLLQHKAHSLSLIKEPHSVSNVLSTTAKHGDTVELELSPRLNLVQRTQGHVVARSSHTVSSLQSVECVIIINTISREHGVQEYNSRQEKRQNRRTGSSGRSSSSRTPARDISDARSHPEIPSRTHPSRGVLRFTRAHASW